MLCEPPCPCALCAVLAACQGAGCTPWRRLGTGALPVAFACCVRRLLLAKGSDVRPGVVWAPALDVQISWQAQRFVNLHVQISWQAQYFVNLHVQISWQTQRFVNLHVHCVRRLLLAQGSDVRPGVTSALPVAFACCVRRLLLAKGSDVRPGVGWAPALDVQISWQAQRFVNLHVQISWQAQYFVNLCVQISWQAQHFVNLHVQLAEGSDVRPGVGWAPALDVQISWQAQHFVNLHAQISWHAQYFVNLRVQISWQAQHFVNLHVQLAKGSDVRPGVGWAPALPVAFACCVRRLLLAQGSDVRPGVGWAPALDVQISWQAQHFVNLHVQISWQAQYFVNLHVQISWQAQHFVNLHVHCVRRLLLAQGSDVRPGVSWAPALCR